MDKLGNLLRTNSIAKSSELLTVFLVATAGFVIGSIILANITRIPESADMSNYAYMKDNIGMLIQPLLS